MLNGSALYCSGNSSGYPQISGIRTRVHVIRYRLWLVIFSRDIIFTIYSIPITLVSFCVLYGKGSKVRIWLVGKLSLMV